MFRSVFDNDPFFNSHGDMSSAFRGLEAFMRPSNLALESRGNRNHNHSNGRDVANMNDFMGFNFPDINAMLQNTMQSFGNEMNDPNGMCYSSSTVYSYCNDGSSNEPHVYQAHKSVKRGPGGLREEQKAERDSRKKEERMAIGRYMGERGRQVERRRNTVTGDQEENNEYYGIDESESEQFNREWEGRANRTFGGMQHIGSGHSGHGHGHDHGHSGHNKPRMVSNNDDQYDYGIRGHKKKLELTDGSTKGHKSRHKKK